MDDDGEHSSEDNLMLMYMTVGAIFLYLVFLVIYVFYYIRQWLSLDKPSYIYYSENRRDDQ